MAFKQLNFALHWEDKWGVYDTKTMFIQRIYITLADAMFWNFTICFLCLIKIKSFCCKLCLLFFILF